MKHHHLLTMVCLFMVSIPGICQITTSELSVEVTGNVTSVQGRLGVGTSDPGYPLDIKADGNNGDLLRLSHPTSPTGAGFMMGFGRNKTQNENGAIDLKVEYGNVDYDVLEINRFNRDLCYMGDGFFGIGTNSPSYLMDIKASISNQDLLRLSHPTSPTGAGFMVGFGQNKDQLSNGSIDFKVQYSNTDFGVLGIDRTNRDFYYIGDGRVGIGTNAPNYKLDVNGSLNAESLYNSGQIQWSDFVFEDDYELPKIEAVEQFIKKNGHLKDIPSEKEVIEEGYDLGNMDSRLLQKIEELTLYMIELNKEMKELREENQKLKNKFSTLADKQ